MTPGREMMSRKDRRRQLVEAMAANVYGESPNAIRRAEPYLDRLLAYLDEHEPDLADRLRNPNSNSKDEN